MIHTCHALGCEIAVNPERLLCPDHWRMVPGWIRAQVWRTYLPGQCDSKQVTWAYLLAAKRAIFAVAVREKVMTYAQAVEQLEAIIERFSRSKDRFADVSGGFYGATSTPSSTSSEPARVASSGGGTDHFEALESTGSENPVGHGQVSHAPSVLYAVDTKPIGGEKGRQAGTADPVPSLTSALSSPLRWPGGKRWLVDQLVPQILACEPDLYVEPFLGAGAIALALPASLPKLLSDYSEPLINLWKVIKRSPRVLASLASMILGNCGNTRDGYLLAREHFNSIDATLDDDDPLDALERAALMLYLNATSYNGVWRESAKSGYNVPFGDVKFPAISDGEELAAIAAHLATARVLHGDYQVVLRSLMERTRTVMPRVVIYADPPYHGGFDDYIAGGFTDEEQIQLATTLREHSEMGHIVFSTNADTELIREAYSWAKLEPIMEARNVAQKTTSRAAVGCLLIRG